jgi:hypothetical protein
MLHTYNHNRHKGRKQKKKEKEKRKHQIKQGVCHTVALPLTLKRYLKVTEEL